MKITPHHGATSMTYWWPKVKALGVPVPRTELVPVGEGVDLGAVLDGARFPPELVTAIVGAAERIGTPCFLRTDLLSGKHGYPKTCLLLDAHPRTVISHLFALLEEHGMALNLPMPRAYAVRELLRPMPGGFNAFHGLPIGRERRYFVRDGVVLCRHPYWPEDAIRFYQVAEPHDWRKRLTALNTEEPGEVEQLGTWAAEIGQALGGEWSVDFMRGASGWYFIDCAVAARSWHPAYERTPSETGPLAPL